MKNICINLHMDQKRIFFMIVFFSCLSFLVYIFMIVSANANFVQLNSLWHSDYVYSAVTQQPVSQDNYYKFNAGISFALSENAETSLNADIVMQSIESEYTDSVYWNADKLGIYDIAISKNIARAFSLNIGDKLYSKHIVNGEICEYNIEQILPEITSVRIKWDKSYGNGVIIMGYDVRYIDNITHHIIIFAKESIEELSLNISGVPESIIYRVDEIITVCKKILPYFLVFVVLSALSTIGLVVFLTRDIEYNFRRMILLGFGKKELDRSYNRLIYVVGVLSIIIAFFASTFIILFKDLCLIEIAFFALIVLVEIVTLFLAAHFSKRRLWRK